MRMTGGTPGMRSGTGTSFLAEPEGFSFSGPVSKRALYHCAVRRSAIR